jgi:hypothetical protein
LGFGFSTWKNDFATLLFDFSTWKNDFATLHFDFPTWKNDFAALLFDFSTWKNDFATLHFDFSTWKNGFPIWDGLFREVWQFPIWEQQETKQVRKKHLTPDKNRAPRPDPDALKIH